MEFVRESLDDILMDLYKSLQDIGTRNTGSRGDTFELLGVALRILKPRMRLSRSEDRGKPFSALGELLWYFACSNEFSFIDKYVPDYAGEAENDGTINGAYGPRLFKMRGSVNQFETVIALLKERSSSRRGVIQIFNAEDLTCSYKDIPCTTTLQFHARNGLLHMSTTMRSNDAYKGLPHDVFCFTMIQEMMAVILGLELGEYYHYAGSMHLYEKNVVGANSFLGEGYQRPIEMPKMPTSDPFFAMKCLLAAEARVRQGEKIAAAHCHNDPYWADAIRLIQAYWASGDGAELQRIKEEIAYTPFRAFVDGRLDKNPRRFEKAPTAC